MQFVAMAADILAPHCCMHACMHSCAGQLHPAAPRGGGERAWARRCCRLPPTNGGLSAARWYSVAPRLYTSLGKPYGCFSKTSGAM